MKQLILFTMGFPYGAAEPFLEGELPLYREYFDHVLVVTTPPRGAVQTRDCGADILVSPILNRSPRAILEALPALLTDPLFYRELFRKPSPRRLYALISHGLCANHQALLARRWLRRHGGRSSIVAYGYWLAFPAHAALRLKHWLKAPVLTAARAHGFDVYPERHAATGGLPYHRALYRSLDRIAPVSRQGKAHLEHHYGPRPQLTVHPLGAMDLGTLNPTAERRVLRVLTCARTVPLKRLDRVADTLAAMDIPIHWTHLGDGPMQAELAQRCKRLPNHITTHFPGQVPNARVYEILRTQPFHLLLNVSQTEGAPVSIMEAMSFGIPVIATDVGGTAEVVGPGGCLIPANFTKEQLASQVLSFARMPEEAYLARRAAAREHFLAFYDAAANYRRFLEWIQEDNP